MKNVDPPKWDLSVKYAAQHNFYETLHNPIYYDENNLTIMLNGKTSDGKIVNFLAVPNDPEPAGIAVYNNAINGKYGRISPYVAPAGEKK